MSSQRAVVNCRRCYELARELISSDYRATQERILKDDRVAEARNEAMKSLEVNIIPLRAENALGNRGIAEINASMAKALDACLSCDYSQARIAEMFDPEDAA
jgi:hypothetical protein